MTIKSAEAELEGFLDKRASIFTEAMFNLLSAIIGRDERKRIKAEEDLADLIHYTSILANLHGRKRILMEMDHVIKYARFTAIPSKTPLSPLVFTEALKDLVEREPRVVPESVPAGQRYLWVQELYNKEHAFAAARSATEKLTKRVQEAISKLISEGEGSVKTENEILKIAEEEGHNWTRAYSSTVWRTNVATAYNNGRMEQAKDPDVKEVIPALEVVGVEDGRERPNHAAFRGLIAATDDPIWNIAKPPYGYNCRHGLDFVSVYRLQSLGLIDKNNNVIRYTPPNFLQAHPDEGFNSGVF